MILPPHIAQVPVLDHVEFVQDRLERKKDEAIILSGGLILSSKSSRLLTVEIYLSHHLMPHMHSSRWSRAIVRYCTIQPRLPLPGKLGSRTAGNTLGLSVLGGIIVSCCQS